MISREFTGKTEDDAVEKALGTLKLKKEQIDIEVLNKNSGILPFGKKDVTIKVSYEDDLDFGNRCLMLVKELLERMNIEAKIYLLEEDDDKIVIEIESPESAIIIGKKGKNLEAIQTIVNVIMNRDFDVWTKVMIDIGNYRNRREKSLKKYCIRIANQVKETQTEELLEPMNPFERRIIHIALKEMEGIETISEGEGTIKRIRIVYNENAVKEA